MKRFVNVVNISKISPENLEKVQNVINGKEYLYQAEVIKKSIKLLLAGLVGLLQPVRTVEPKPYLALVSQFNVPMLGSELGKESDANAAFTEFFEMLRPDLRLTKANCDKIMALYETAGLSSILWETLFDDQQYVIRKMFYYKGIEWFDFPVTELTDFDKLWQKLDATPVSSGNFDMRYIVPSYLLSEINGYYHPFFRHLNTYVPLDYVFSMVGPHVFNQSIIFDGPEEVEFRFDTISNPAPEIVFLKLSKLFQCKVEHFYNDYPSHTSGSYRYRNGTVIDVLPKK